MLHGSARARAREVVTLVHRALFLRQHASAQFRERSERYRLYDSDPRIRERTAFFSAAHVVTAVLAFGPVSAFVAELSLSLEAVNFERAQQVRSGALYPRRTLLANTVDFIQFEQRQVELALDRLRRCTPHGHATEIATLNAGIRRASLWLSRFISPAHAAMHRAIHSSRAALGRWPDFARQADRETLGLHLALASRE